MRAATTSLFLIPIVVIAAVPGGKVTGTANMQRQDVPVISRIHLFGQEREIYPAKGLVSNEVIENGPIGAVWEGNVVCLIVSDTLHANGVITVTDASDGSGGPHPNPRVFPGQNIWFSVNDGGEPSVGVDNVRFSVMTDDEAVNFCTCIKTYESVDPCSIPTRTADWQSIGNGNIQVHPR